MRQDNVITLTMFAAFVVFVTARGELPRYMGFLIG